jgi:hypothetical protein
LGRNESFLRKKSRISGSGMKYIECNEVLIVLAECEEVVGMMIISG